MIELWLVISARARPHFARRCDLLGYSDTLDTPPSSVDSAVVGVYVLTEG
jgi:hypothetical protein